MKCIYLESIYRLIIINDISISRTSFMSGIFEFYAFEYQKLNGSLSLKIGKKIRLHFRNSQKINHLSIGIMILEKNDFIDNMNLHLRVVKIQNL